MNAPVQYGLVVGVAIFVTGWITGLGGSFLPNLIFGAAMGLFAGVLFWLVKRFAGPRNK